MSRYTRAQWGARYRAGFGSRAGNYPLRENWLHHSVTAHLSPNATFAQEAAQMRILENIGQQRFGGGISYNFVIFPSGRAYHGLGASRIGAHTAGRNSIALSVVFAGNYSNTAPTAAALGAAAQLLKDLRSQGVLAQARFSGGHRDAPGNAGTACPGNALRNRISTINSQATGGSSTPASPARPTAPASSTPSSGGSTMSWTTRLKSHITGNNLQAGTMLRDVQRKAHQARTAARQAVSRLDTLRDRVWTRNRKSLVTGNNTTMSATVAWAQYHATHANWKIDALASTLDELLDGQGKLLKAVKDVEANVTITGAEEVAKRLKITVEDVEEED